MSSQAQPKPRTSAPAPLQVVTETEYRKACAQIDAAIERRYREITHPRPHIPDH